MKTNKNEYSPELHNMLSRFPKRIAHWGLGLFFLISILVIGINNYIKYPEVSSMRIEIEKSNYGLYINDVYGKINITVSDMSKIKVGQSVRIRLDKYPYVEYGFLSGTIVNIQTSKYSNPVAIVSLSKDLITSTKYKIKYTAVLIGFADITLSNKPLFSKISESFLHKLRLNEN
jgi:hypothetical protein